MMIKIIDDHGSYSWVINKYSNHFVIQVLVVFHFLSVYQLADVCCSKNLNCAPELAYLFYLLRFYDTETPILEVDGTSLTQSCHLSVWRENVLLKGKENLSTLYFYTGCRQSPIKLNMTA